MKKIISVFIFLFLFTSCKTDNKIELDAASKIDLKLTSENGLIELQLNQDETDKFIDLINNLAVEKTAPQDIKGWNLYARGLDDNNNEIFRVSFIANLIDVNDTWYQANQNSLEKITDNYK